MPESSRKKILIVDDQPIICDMLADHLGERYNVATLPSADEALGHGQLDEYDLVISDIKMPGMPGYEFLREVKRINNRAKVALITAYDVDDYIKTAKEYGICNIIAKTTPFDFLELDAVVDSLLSENIFGHERYMAGGYVLLGEYTIRRSGEAEAVWSTICEQFGERLEGIDTESLLLAMKEIFINAIYHAPRTADGEAKYERETEVDLTEGERVTVKSFLDEEKYGVSVVDSFGSLNKEQVLYLLDRHTSMEGLLDTSGRGIYMSRMMVGRIIINIKPRTMTEVIFYNYLAPREGYKPLYINEI